MNKEEFRREVKEKAIKAQELMFTQGPTTKGILRDLEKHIDQVIKGADTMSRKKFENLLFDCYDEMVYILQDVAKYVGFFYDARCCEMHYPVEKEYLFERTNIWDSHRLDFVSKDLEKYQKELKWADLYTKNQVKEIVKQCLSDENIATHYLNRY